MPDIKRHKSLIFFVAAFVLLSFFFSAWGIAGPGQLSERAGMNDGFVSERAVEMRADCGTVKEIRHGVSAEAGHGTGLMAPAPLGTPNQGLPAGKASFSLARMMFDDIATREQQMTRTLLARFLAVLMLFVLCVITACRTAIRRFGAHMIPLWEHIYYIHQIDGEKGNAILYT